MELAQAIKEGFRNALKWTGRMARPRYWLFAPFGLLFGLLMSILIVDLFAPIFPFSFALILVPLMPLTSATVRRLHDAGGNAWPAILLFFGPVILPITVIFGVIQYFEPYAPSSDELVTRWILASGLGFLSLGICLLAGIIATLQVTLLPSQPGPNKYGPNPNEVPS